MDKRYTLSVIIPAYNSEKTLSQTLDSVLNQQCKDIEVIIVNDGSSDNTETICKEYCKNYENIKYFKKNNSGVSDTRNLGIENAEGTYIAFLDSDDIWDPKYYDDKLNEQLKSEEYDILVFSSCFSDMKFNVTEYVRVENKILTDAKDKAVDIYYHSFCSFIFKHSLLKNNNIQFCNKLRYGEDELFRSQCLYCANKIYAEDKISFYYRDNVNSATKVNRKQKLYAKQKLDVYYLLKDFFLTKYKDEGSTVLVKNATTAKYLVEAVKLLSEMGYGYAKIKSLCNKENLQLIYNNIDKYYQMHYSHRNTIESYLKSPLLFYIKNRFYGLWYYNAVNLKHWLMKIKK